ncbi:hypothetical protein D3C72_2322500 [compost metagenome]
MHLLGQRHVGQRGIALQQAQDGLVGAVQGTGHRIVRCILAANFYCSHGLLHEINGNSNEIQSINSLNF